MDKNELERRMQKLSLGELVKGLLNMEKAHNIMLEDGCNIHKEGEKYKEIEEKREQYFKELDRREELYGK